MSRLLVLLHLCHVICLLFGKIVSYTNAEHILHTITGNYMQNISQTPKPNPSILTFCSFLDPCPSIS